MTSKMSSELILGAAIGYSSKQVSPFLSSLRIAGYDGDVVLFVDRALAQALANAELHGLTLIAASQWLPFKWKRLIRPRPMRYIWKPLQATGVLALKLAALTPSASLGERVRRRIACVIRNPMDARFIRYLRFLEAHPEYERILLTDVRDVVFQAPPFRDLPGEGLCVSIEAASYTLGSEPYNAEWIKRTYGGEALASVAHERVSCVGVTLGSRAAILDYLTLTTGEMLRIAPWKPGLAGADTAVHNMLLRTGRLGVVHELETFKSPVATLNAVDVDDARLSPDGVLLNEDGSAVAIVHQYDRVAGLAEAVRSRLAS